MVTQTVLFTSKSDRAALFSETSMDRASQPQFKSVSYSPGRPLPPKLLETPVNHRPQVIRISKPNLHLLPPPPQQELASFSFLPLDTLCSTICLFAPKAFLLC